MNSVTPVSGTPSIHPPTQWQLFDAMQEELNQARIAWDSANDILISNPGERVTLCFGHLMRLGELAVETVPPSFRPAAVRARTALGLSTASA